jgi:hypothetical protein
MRKIRTLVEDFQNPCFGSAIHNEIPRTLGLVVLQHFMPSRDGNEESK